MKRNEIIVDAFHQVLSRRMSVFKTNTGVFPAHEFKLFIAALDCKSSNEEKKKTILCPRELDKAFSG